MKKRTKQVQAMVDMLNDYLKYNKVINEFNDVKEGLTWLLLGLDLYYGYNYFYDKEIDGKTVMCHAGTADKDKLKELNAYIQLY